MEAIDQLKQFFNSIHPISAEAWGALLQPWEEVSFSRKEVLTKPGAAERYMYYVLEGVQRSYYVKDGKEYTIAFTYPPSFTGIPESFLSQRLSKIYLETLTPSRFLRLSHSSLMVLMDDFREIERLVFKSYDLVLAGIMDRYIELRALSMEERFKAFTGRSPHLLQLVPQKYLASYLNIDPTNFSKLMSTVRI